MSLMAFTGKQRNLLDETPEHCRQLKLPHPILTNEDVERLRTVTRSDFRVATLPALFPACDREAGRASAQGPGASWSTRPNGPSRTGRRC